MSHLSVLTAPSCILCTSSIFSVSTIRLRLAFLWVILVGISTGVSLSAKGLMKVLVDRPAIITHHSSKSIAVRGGAFCKKCKVVQFFSVKLSTDTDPNTGKNRSSPIFRYSSEFRYSSRSWQTHHSKQKVFWGSWCVLVFPEVVCASEALGHFQVVLHHFCCYICELGYSIAKENKVRGNY